MRTSGYKHRAGYRSVIWKRSFDFYEKLCVSLFNKDCEHTSVKEKKNHITIYADVVNLIFSVDVSENVVFFLDENFYPFIIG